MLHNALDVALAVLSLGALVLLHEAGHFAAARACRMRVDVFSVGFGPALLSYRGRQTEYRIAVVPLGGYVRIAGMAPGDFPPDDPAAFHARPWWQRLCVLFAGPLLNWLFAVAMLWSLYAVGYRVPTGEPVIEEVRGRLAAASGLVPGDRVLAVDGEALSTWSELSHALSVKSGAVEIRIRRNDVELALTARSGADVHKGITAESRTVRFPVLESGKYAVMATLAYAVGMLGDLRDWILRKPGPELMGPVAVVGETVQAARTGLEALFFMLVMISLALALMNLLPLPALDGGRLLFVLVSAVRRRPVDLRVEAVVHASGVLVLTVLLVALSWKELGRYFSSAPEAPSAPDASAGPARR